MFPCRRTLEKTGPVSKLESKFLSDLSSPPGWPTAAERGESFRGSHASFRLYHGDTFRKSLQARRVSEQLKSNDDLRGMHCQFGEKGTQRAAIAWWSWGDKLNRSITDPLRSPQCKRIGDRKDHEHYRQTDLCATGHGSFRPQNIPE